MKRDMDLARRILFEIEEFPQPGAYGQVEVEDYSSEMISYHVKLLAEAGLIEARDGSTFGRFDWKAGDLTWEGHEFLDAARDDNRWNKTKTIIVEKVGTLTFAVLKQGLVEAIRTAVFPSPNI